MPQLFTVVHRDGRWYVESEAGKPLGDYDTEGEANERLRQVEAAKAAKSEHSALSLFDQTRDEGGRVRAGVWDFVCVEGWDLKEKRYTAFTPETLSEMVRNFAERGDLVAYDWNHQSGYSEINGQPAPALAFAGALAVVWDGKVLAHAGASNPERVQYSLLDGAGRQNGLWAFRSEVTDGTAEFPLGQQLLPGFKYISPMFTSHGQNRHGDDVGYSLLAIACTNTPWQPGTAIAFGQREAPPSAAAGSKKGPTMKLSKLAAFLVSTFGVKFDAADGDDKVKEMAHTKLEDEAMGAATEPTFDYEGSAAKAEEMARLYEDAHPEPDGDEEEPLPVMARKMAAKFRRMSKMGEAPLEEEKDKPPADMAAFARSMGVDPAGKTRAQLMDALGAVTMRASAVEELVRKESQRVYREEQGKLEAATKKEKAAVLMSSLRAEYPGDKAALQRYAESNPEDAAIQVQGWLKTEAGAPRHLFSRLSSQGAPLGKESDARGEVTNFEARTTDALGSRFIETDSPYADAIKAAAESKDPVMMGKIDAHLTPADRSLMFARLLAAKKVVHAERPELLKYAED